MFTSVFKFFCQQQSGNQRESHHKHGNIGWTQALLGEPYQAAAPQQQAHVKVEITQFHQADTLCAKTYHNITGMWLSRLETKVKLLSH